MLSHTKLVNTKPGTRIKKDPGQAPVAHAYNPSYSEGRNQEDYGSKPALGK
jgi:hypothetical protein